MPKQIALTIPLTGALLLAGVVSLANPALMDLLWYSREGIGAGQWWRLASGHLVHHSGWHLLLNVLVFAGLAGWIEWLAGARRLAILLMILTLGIGIGLYAWVPQMGFYAGVSAVNYGMLAWLALDSRSLARPVRLGGMRLRISWLALPLLVGLCILQWLKGVSLVPGGETLTLVAWQAHLLGIGLAIVFIGTIPERQSPVESANHE